MIRAFLFTLLAWGAGPLLAQNLPVPPAPHVRAATNPVSGKTYVIDESGNRVVVLDSAGSALGAIPVGPRPQFIAVDPSTNRLYVSNAGDASLTVIDGATDTNLSPTPYPVGSLGPMVVNPTNGVVYIVRLTSPATDEVTFFNTATTTWYTIATESWQPVSMGLNPGTNKIFVAHYAGNDVRIISGVYDDRADFPATVAVGTGRKPFAIVVNPVTNRAFVIIDNPSGPIALIDGNTATATFPAIQSGHAVSPRGLAIDTATNKVYAAFAGEVIVIDGATGGLTYVPVDTGSTSAALAVNAITNRIYVAADSGRLTVINGDTLATSTRAIPAGESSIALNPVTNRLVVASATATTVLDGDAAPAHALPLTASITPVEGNRTGQNPTFTLQVTGTYAPGLPARRVYVRLDDTNGPWTAATGNGPYSASFAGLASGPHTLYAFAADDQLVPLVTGPQSYGTVGTITSYAFSVMGDASLSMTSSANPSTVGQAVTFTMSVAGGSAPPTGTVTLRDGTTALAGCNSLVLASGAASCSTAALAAGSHSLTIAYSGDGAHAPATSAPFVQSVVRGTPTVTLASSANPSVVGTAVKFTATVAGAATAPTGSVAFRDGSQAIAGCESVTLASGQATCTASGLSLGSHAIVAGYAGDGAYAPAESPALAQSVQPAPQPGISVSPTTVDFGGESMATTTAPVVITVTNTGTATLHVSGVSVGGADASQFASATTCAAVAPGATCPVSVTFTPAIADGALNATFPASATLSVASDAASSPSAVALSGTGERSLVTHFYEAILRRAPDGSGRPFWSSEAERAAGLGANVNEAWYAMAMSFFASPEYGALARDDAAFVTDLYRTFFNRAPDADGMAFWTGQLGRGIPRDVVLVSFMLSPEFTGFSQSIFGNTAARAEVDLVMDLYRGPLARLPDSDGFRYWVQRLRVAQCQGSEAVTAEVESMSRGFLQGGEYADRHRTNGQYVGDMYNTFLRRGGDESGVRAWLADLDSGARTRDQVRQAFIASPEFSARVNAVVQQGCPP